MTGSLTFQIDGLRVRIEAGVLATFDAHRQIRFWQREAGGQLFGRISRGSWVVAHATQPGRADRRWRLGFEPDRAREQHDIYDFHSKGFDYFGDWHTHPQDVPEPSPRDLASIGDIVRNSTHHLPGFLLCIVGRVPFPTGLWLSIHDRDGHISRAVPSPSPQSGLGQAGTSR